jgi:hypothetical protein
MTITEIINELRKIPSGTIIKHGFSNPDSYRGSYDCLGLEPVENVKVEDMITCLESAIGNTFEGYKGGDFTMYEDTECYMAEYGCCGEEINSFYVNLIKLEACNNHDRLLAENKRLAEELDTAKVLIADWQNIWCENQGGFDDVEERTKKFFEALQSRGNA